MANVFKPTEDLPDSTADSHDAINAHEPNSIYLDESIPFEAYHYWANRARQAEQFLNAEGIAQRLGSIFSRQKTATRADSGTPRSATEKPELSTSLKVPHVHASDEARFGVTESEWEQANRATRTATWGTTFYLITTDILGPYNVPWAISQMGYGPGITLYVVFGGMAFYSGLQLWRQFIGLDSPRYPMRNYGDLGFRLYGKWARMLINILQSCQFFLNVTIIIEASGQGLQQMAAGKSGTGVLCFVVAELIFTILGFLFGQIRTLRQVGWLANVAVWLNVFVILMTMGVIPAFGPNYEASAAAYKTTPNQPIRTSAYWPSDSTLNDRVNGLMNGVFAYGGATLFNEFMAEMRRPMDFWKALLCADVFIFSIYLTIGLVVYSYQGQYTYNPAYQGIPNSAYAWQTVGNAISFISSIIAAVLYGNIGIKVLYAVVLRDIFGFPALEEKKGKRYWMALVPIYWALAFLIAAAVPQISYLISFVGAAFIFQFSYSFPPILMVAYNVHKDSMLPEDEPFDPTTGHVTRIDHGWQRWMRGYKQKIIRNTFDVLYFFASLGTAGLGIYAAVIGIHDSFRTTKLTPFTCDSPTG